MLHLLATPLVLAPLQDAARHHPAGAQVYLEVPDVQAAFQAYRRTALPRALEDPALHAALGRLTGRESFQPLQYLGQAYDRAVSEGELPPLGEILAEPLQGLSLSLYLEGGLQELFAAIEAADGERDGLEALLERATLQLELAYSDDVHAAAVLELVDGIGLSGPPGRVERTVLEDGELKLITYAPRDVPVSVPVSVVALGGRVVLGIGGKSGRAMLERLKTDQGGIDPAALAKALPAGQEGVVTVLTLHNRLATEAWSVPQLQPTAPAVEFLEGLFGSLASMLLRGGDWRVVIDGRGQFQSEGRRPVPASPFERVLGCAPIEREALSLVHPEAIVARVAHFDKSALLAGIAALQEQSGNDFMAGFEEQTGVRLDRDLLEPLGPAMAYSLPAPTSLLSAPPFTLAFALSDRATFEPGLGNLLRYLTESSDGFVSLNEADYRGARLLTLQFHLPDVPLDLPIPVDPAALLRPTFVVMDQRFFVTTLPTHAKAEIRRLARDEVELHGLLATATLPPGTTSYGFSDWTQFFGQLYMGGRALATVAGSMSGEELPFDLSALPEAEVVTRHFAPSLRWRTLAGGEIREHESSSTGPELVLALPAAALVGTLVRGTRTAPAPPDADGAGAEGDGR